MTISDLPIIGSFNRQRFPQFCPEDTANWYILPNDRGKKKMAMYPTSGRHHINYVGVNKLIFAAESRGVFESDDFWYAVVNNTIFRVDQFFNVVDIASGSLATITGNIFFDFLVIGNITFACFADGQKIYVYQENTGVFLPITDSNAPAN